MMPLFIARVIQLFIFSSHYLWFSCSKFSKMIKNLFFFQKYGLSPSICVAMLLMFCKCHLIVSFSFLNAMDAPDKFETDLEQNQDLPLGLEIGSLQHYNYCCYDCQIMLLQHEGRKVAPLASIIQLPNKTVYKYVGNIIYIIFEQS